MKGISLLLFTLLLLYSCIGAVDKTAPNQGQETAQTEVDTIFHVDPEEEPSNDWKKQNLKGRIKSISIQSNQIDENGEEYGMGGYYERYEFNEKGLLTQMSMSGCCGAYSEEVEYKYNDKGQLTHRILRQSEPSDDIDYAHFETKEKYFYNEDGVLVKIKVAGEDQQLDLEHEFSYNEKGELITEKVKDIEDEEEIILYSNESDQKIRSHITGDKGYEEVDFLDEKGNVSIHELHLNSGEIQETKYTYEYDAKGNWIVRESVYRYIYKDGKKDPWQNSLKENRTIVYY